MKGWIGRIAEVNLAKRKVIFSELRKEIAIKFLGGRGLGAYYMTVKVNPKVNPFSPENCLVLAVGPLTGTITPSSGRCCLIGKSPLTNTIFDSNAGGKIGFEIKASGFDAIIINGISDKPVNLVINTNSIRIENANDYWGLSTGETIEALKRDYGREYEIACIGPAGENQVYFANIRCSDGNFFGRGGLGAIMGSKKLKAIIVKGELRVEVGNEEKMIELWRKCIDRMKINPVVGKVLPKFGTRFLVNIINASNALPAYNFKFKKWNEASKLSGEVFLKFIVRRKACSMCPIACKNIIKINGFETHGPEYETVWALGINCGINDLKIVARANKLCNEYGLDTISMGGTLACLMELSERGIIKEKVNWGDGELVLKLIEETAYKKDLGKLLALGSSRMAEKLGFKEASMTVKNLELPAYDPRELLGMALAYATSNRGGCHLRAYMTAMEVLGLPILIDRKSIIGKAELVAVNQNFMAIADSLIICKFAALELDDEILSHILSAVTGIKFDRGELMKIGERIWNLERMFNLKAGITSKDDRLPTRIMNEIEIQLNEMLKAYYEIRGWNEYGIPTKSKIEELGLEELIKF